MFNPPHRGDEIFDKLPDRLVVCGPRENDARFTHGPAFGLSTNLPHLVE
jgi:hypothetical protein